MRNIVLFIFIFLISLTIPLKAEDDHPTQTKHDSASLKKILPENTNTGVLIQPGTEASNQVVDEKSAFEDSLIEKIENFFKRFDDWFERNFSNLPAVSSGKQITNLNWLVAVFVIAVLIYFFTSIAPFLQKSGSNLNQKIIEQETLLLSINDALQKAEAYAKANDIPAALTELLSGFFKGLDELERIPYKQSRTNREYQRIIRRKAAKHMDFASNFLPYMDGILYAGKHAELEKYTEFYSSLKKSFAL